MRNYTFISIHEHYNWPIITWADPLSVHFIVMCGFWHIFVYVSLSCILRFHTMGFLDVNKL